MTENSDAPDAFARLQDALKLLDRAGLHLAAADVCTAIDRLRKSPLGLDLPAEEACEPDE